MAKWNEQKGLLRVTLPGFSLIGKIAFVLIGIVGLYLILSGTLYALTTNLSRDDTEGAWVFMIIIGGVMLFLAFMMNFQKSGVEIDLVDKQMRDFSGILGRTKEEWIDISEASYLALVGKSMSTAPMPTRPSAWISYSKAQLNLIFENSYLQIFLGDTDDAIKLSLLLSEHLKLEVYNRMEEEAEEKEEEEAT